MPTATRKRTRSTPTKTFGSEVEQALDRAEARRDDIVLAHREGRASADDVLDADGQLRAVRSRHADEREHDDAERRARRRRTDADAPRAERWRATSKKLFDLCTDRLAQDGAIDDLVNFLIEACREGDTDRADEVARDLLDAIAQRAEIQLAPFLVDAPSAALRTMKADTPHVVTVGVGSRLVNVLRGAPAESARGQLAATFPGRYGTDGRTRTCHDVDRPCLEAIVGALDLGAKR